MASFAYVGRGADGRQTKGTLDAANARDAAVALQGRGILPISIKSKAAPQVKPKPGKETPTLAPAGGTGAGTGTTATDISAANKDLFPKPVDSLDIMMFSRQIYTLLKAGVPIMRALAGLQESATKPTMISLLQDLRENLDAGRELSAALAQHQKIFSTFYISMVRVGEMTGQLETIFLRLYHQLAFERFMKEQVTSALRYPMFVIIAMVVALFVVNIFVIPAFAKVFASSKAELPLMTKILLGFSDFMINWWHVMLGMIAAAVFAFKTWVKTESGQYQWDYIKLRLPVAGKIVNKATMARFTRSFALASKSGVPIIQALTTVAQTVDNNYYAKKIEIMREGVERGDTVLRVASQSGIFAPVVLQMIAVGEESGTLDDLMQEIAEMFQGEIEYELKTLAQQIEPILIVFLGIMVLVLALGIFLPIWDMGKVSMNK